MGTEFEPCNGLGFVVLAQSLRQASAPTDSKRSVGQADAGRDSVIRAGAGVEVSIAVGTSDVPPKDLATFEHLNGVELGQTVDEGRATRGKVTSRELPLAGPPPPPPPPPHSKFAQSQPKRANTHL